MNNPLAPILSELLSAEAHLKHRTVLFKDHIDTGHERDMEAKLIRAERRYERAKKAARAALTLAKGAA